jgi:hypothetical protein
MTTPAEDIGTFLQRRGTAQGRRLEVAILFADSMLRELGVAVAEWEDTAARLRRLKREMTSPCSN